MRSFPKESQSYDYIIIGAGSAGSVIAHRLSSMNVGRIGLLECGSRSSSRMIRRPAVYANLFSNPRYSYCDLSTPQTNLAQRRILLPSGKGLGGSSLINGMILMPPHPSDLSRLSSIVGDTLDSDWSEIERRITDHYDLPPRQPLHAASEWFHSQLCPAEAHYVFPFRRTQREGKRTSVWDAFMRTQNHSNLSLYSDCTVDSLLFDGDQASGVIARRGMTKVAMKAAHGVIVCCGALKSPMLLMASGIGPQDMLQQAGILCRFDSPNVGRNLHDHLVFPVIFETPIDALTTPFSAADQQQWQTTGLGPVSSNIAELGAFFCNSNGQLKWTDHSQQTSAQPTFQWHVTPTHYLEYPLRSKSKHSMSIGVTCLHPKSRGDIQLQPNGSFLINPNYLSQSQDTIDLVEAVDWTRRWLHSNLASVPEFHEQLPGRKRDSLASLRSAVEKYASTLFHYGGTCSVGQENDSVCDPSFRVRGVRGLYVCDASSLPTTLSGNTQLTVMMLAWRFCDLLQS